jgi:hypothetical protein
LIIRQIRILIVDHKFLLTPNKSSNFAAEITNMVKEIDYDPDNYIRKDGQERPPEAALAHELGHAENDMNGTSVTYNEDMANGKIGTPAQQAIEQEKQNRNEVNSIYYENIVREKKEYPQRGYNYSAGD